MLFISLIVHFIFIISLFVWNVFGSASMNKVAIVSLLMFLLSIYALHSHSSSGYYNNVKNASSNRYYLLTTIFFGYFLVVGFLNSAIYYGMKNALINAILLTPIFIYLFASLIKNPAISLKITFNIFLIYALVSSVLSFFEYVMYSKIPVVNTYVQILHQQSKHSNLVPSLLDKENILRTFGLFNDSLINGLVLSMAAVFLAAYLLYYQQKKVLAPLFALTILISGIFLTQNRNSMLILAIGSIVVFLFKNRKIRVWCNNFPLFVSFLWFVIYIVLVLITVWHVDTSRDVTTLTSRVITWKVVLNKYIMHAQLDRFLFGYGISSFVDEHRDRALWSLDNSMIQIYMYCGAIGIVLFNMWWIWVSTKLLQIAVITSDYRHIAVYTLFVQYFIAGVYNTTTVLMPTALLVILLGYLSIRIGAYHSKESFSVQKRSDGWPYENGQ